MVPISLKPHQKIQTNAVVVNNSPSVQLVHKFCCRWPVLLPRMSEIVAGWMFNDETIFVIVFDNQMGKKLHVLLRGDV